MKYIVGQHVRFKLNETCKLLLHGEIVRATYDRFANPTCTYQIKVKAICPPFLYLDVAEADIVNLYFDTIPKEKFPGEFDGWVVKGFEDEKI